MFRNRVQRIIIIKVGLNDINISNTVVKYNINYMIHSVNKICHGKWIKSEHKKWKINCCFNLKQEATKQISDENNWVGRPRCALPHFHNFCSTYIFMTERRENVLIALCLRHRSGRLLDLKVRVECFASAIVYLVAWATKLRTYEANDSYGAREPPTNFINFHLFELCFIRLLSIPQLCVMSFY